ncbi:MAG: hypothetical protein K2X38_09115 [Gemmataceae bacterium]|nr:hypothetical protein [Gemmataceae bacterium]
MILHVDTAGQVTCLYGEAINLASLGKLTIRRASHVEADDQGHWHADLSPVGGPMLGPCAVRSIALAAEAAWLNDRLPSMASTLKEEPNFDHDRPNDGTADLGGLVPSGLAASTRS